LLLFFVDGDVDFVVVCGCAGVLIVDVVGCDVGDVVVVGDECVMVVLLVLWLGPVLVS